MKMKLRLRLFGSKIRKQASDEDKAIKRRKFNLFALSEKEGSKQFEGSLTLKRQMEIRSETWRMQLPRDVSNPLTIKRSPIPKRKVTFKDIWLMGRHREDSVETGSVKSNTNSNACLVLKNTANMDDGVYSYDNTNYNVDETENDRECFVAAFGKKGKEVGEFEDAKDIVCLEGGQLLISDMVLGRLQKFSNKSSTATVLVTGETTNPWGVVVTKENTVAVAVCKERCVKVFTMDGELLQTFGEDYLLCPTGIACDLRGNFIVCDSSLNKVLMFSQQGLFIKFIGNSERKEERFSKPRYVCVSINGDVIISDSGNHRVTIFNSYGDFVRSFGSFGKADGQFKCPYGVCTNNIGEIFVADHYNNRISMFSQDGVFIRHLITHDNGIVHPQGIIIDKNMQMYVTHGHLKATEVLLFHLINTQNEIPVVELISYV